MYVRHVMTLVVTRACLAASLVGFVAGDAFAADSRYAVQHYCYSHDSSTICSVQSSIRSVDQSLTETDLFIVPHRGRWGLIDASRVPENSVSAMQNALSNGYAVVEMDILRVADGFVGSHDFVFPRITDSSSSAWMWQKTVSEIRQLRLRDRQGRITSENVMSLADALSTAVASNMVIMIDTRPKKAHFVDGRCVALCEYLDGSVRYDAAYMSNIVDVIDQAAARNALANLVFKVPYPVDYVQDSVGARFYKVLWMVQVNPTKLQWYLVNHGLEPSGYTVTLQDLVSFSNNWIESNKTISAWETAYKTSSDLRLRAFRYGGVSYDNLLSYLISVSNRRPGMFSGEPAGARGLVNEFADWRMTPDVRANHVEIINHPGAKQMIMTTDRPDVWEQMND